MPSVSKSQQRLMGVAYAVKSGDMEISDVDPAYRDKVKSMVDGMTKKSLKKYASTKHDDLPETVSEAFIGPFVFNDKTPDEELKAMYFSALDGYSYHQKGMHYSKSDYKKAYQEIEKILKKKGIALDEDFAHAAQNITPSANIGGMGPVVFPSDGIVGSGDVPAIADIDEEDEDEKKKDKTKKKLEMEGIKLFTQFGDFISESFDQRPGQLVKDLHFESINEDYEKHLDRTYGRNRDYSTITIQDLHFQTDTEELEKMKLAYGYRMGGITSREKIEDADYALRRFRKEIGYGDGKDVGVFIPGSYDAATSKLGDGPHKKAVAKVKFNRKKYDQWVEDVASNDGWKNAFDMAQNAKFEPGLLQWAKKEFRGEDVMQRIQWDIEAYAESVKTPKTIKRIYEARSLDRDEMMKFIDKHMRIAGTSEEFNGSEGGIWVSGEDTYEFKGKVIYDYYAEGSGYELGVNVKWEKELNKRGWYSEWYDAGTVQIWPI